MLNKPNSLIKLTLLILLLVIPTLSFASDMSGLLYVLGIQVVLMFWPLILPLFFLKNDKPKLQSYVYKVVIVYGLLGLVSLLQNMYSTLGLWIGIGNNLDMGSAAGFRLLLVYISHPLVLIVSILLFKFYSFTLPRKKTSINNN